ncbi:MAG: LysM peptidoglycan-binding domain-containing protein [Bacteroidetes bacterium]|nr:MAG: LysM peptidoglycan-binding domain-containing protein [Bacteroidota bacterium]
MFGKKLLLSFISIFTAAILVAQDEATIREYISKYKDIAIAEMQRTGIPASIKLAQGIHETSAGTSVLVQKSNNHFGLKCKTEWTGMTVKHTDDAPNECFRKYSNPADSYKDQSDYLRNTPRYASLFELDPTDYKSWATGLKSAGYATNPKYAPVLIKLIEEYGLQDYTLIALGKLKESDLANKISITDPVMIQPGPAEEIVLPEPVKPSYPTGEFKINETKVVYITKGTSYLSVAQQYNIPLARIFDFNDMKETEAADKDRLIYLMRKRKTGNNEFHIVRPGETLHDIAQEEAIRIESLLEYNYLSYNQKPAIGEKLNLLTKAAAQPKLALNENVNLGFAKINNEKQSVVVSAEGKTGTLEHVVAQKETIYSIARRYDVKIEDIVKWNSLQGYDLKTGQQLKIIKL